MGDSASGATENHWNDDATSLVAWYNLSYAREVGNKKENALGVRDISGNVAEWCFVPGSISGERIMRGGCYLSSSEYMRIGLIQKKSDKIVGNGI